MVAPPSSVSTARPVAPPTPPVASARSHAPDASDVLDAGDAGERVDPVVDRAVEARKSELVVCYRTGLTHDPKLRGRMVLSVRLDARGKPVSVTTTANDGVPPGVAACVARVLRGADFAAAMREVLDVPLVFYTNVYDGAVVATRFDPGY